jgi:hypothetical protein
MLAFVRNVGLSLFASCIVATAAYGASQTTPVGGTGGGPFRILCPSHKVLIGFSYNSGSALDAIAPICTNIDKKGHTKGPTALPGWAGGKGGSNNTLVCPRDTIVYSMNVFVDKFEIVNHVELRCRELLKSSPNEDWIKKAHGGQSARNFEVHCQVNHIPNGIHGNSGALVDRVGLLCDLASLITK